jgi:hypothetical protein
MVTMLSRSSQLRELTLHFEESTPAEDPCFLELMDFFHGFAARCKSLRRVEIAPSAYKTKNVYRGVWMKSSPWSDFLDETSEAMQWSWASPYPVL